MPPASRICAQYVGEERAHPKMPPKNVLISFGARRALRCPEPFFNSIYIGKGPDNYKFLGPRICRVER